MTFSYIINCFRGLSSTTWHHDTRKFVSWHQCQAWFFKIFQIMTSHNPVFHFFHVMFRNDLLSQIGAAELKQNLIIYNSLHAIVSHFNNFINIYIRFNEAAKPCHAIIFCIPSIYNIVSQFLHRSTDTFNTKFVIYLACKTYQTIVMLVSPLN